MKKVVKTEFNIEGYPDKRYMDIVLELKPTQATLVPDPPDVLTSNAGWDTVKHRDLLKEIITELKRNGIRTSIFVDPDEKMASEAAECGTDRVELYTEVYASNFQKNRERQKTSIRDTFSLDSHERISVSASYDRKKRRFNAF